MVSTSGDSSGTRHVFKNVQYPSNFEHPAPEGSLLLDILKTMELEFQQRGYLPVPENGSFHPLWFIATSERNNFLWRNGYSLNAQQNFEFWVDLEALAKKRMYQLELLNEGFSFSNPTWGLATPSEANITRELDYLQTFLMVTAKIQRHVYALSRAGLLLQAEIRPEDAPKQVVVLPLMKAVVA